MFYEHLTRMVVMPSYMHRWEEWETILGEQIMDDTFTLPRLKYLLLSLRDTGDPRSIRHTTVFNRLCFPQLEELSLTLSPSIARHPALSDQETQGQL